MKDYYLNLRTFIGFVFLFLSWINTNYLLKEGYQFLQDPQYGLSLTIGQLAINLIIAIGFLSAGITSLTISASLRKKRNNSEVLASPLHFKRTIFSGLSILPIYLGFIYFAVTFVKTFDLSEKALTLTLDGVFTVLMLVGISHFTSSYFKIENEKELSTARIFLINNHKWKGLLVVFVMVALILSPNSILINSILYSVYTVLFISILFMSKEKVIDKEFDFIWKEASK